ncbi:MAG: AAA family ATPase [bacterium]|nr:AAA family ATPase [bacterium]
MKKIPYGISDFRKLRKDNCLYIDKTRYIELIESYDEPYIFFLRPRRFGKTLLISLLDYYYDNNSCDEFETLFQELYIGKNPTRLQNSYYILRFNFSGINTSSKEQLLEDFTKKTVESLEAFETRYRINISYDKTGMPSSIFYSFLSKVEFSIEGKIYVLVDEYDHLANELLSFQTELFEEVVSKTGFVRKWYEVLKIGTEKIVDKIFATGVSPITLDSLTSGFNIASDLTRDLNLNAMLGFSEHEVVTLLQSVLGHDADIAAILPELQTYYDGYRFSEEAQIRLFNPDMILYYLTNYSKYHKPPKDLIDTNITSDYAKMQQLFTLKYRERNYRILRDILEGTPQETLITRQFSLAKKFTSDDFRSLLFYLGFLTVEHAELSGVLLRVPNYVIQELYFTFFGELLEEEAQYELDAADIRQSIATIARTGEIADFLHLVETALEKLSFRDYIHFDEKYVKLIMLTYLMMSKVYYVKSEYEVPKGYIDIALLKRSGVDPTYEALFEIKYLKKEEYNDPKKSGKLLHEKIEQARRQLVQYTQSEELKEKNNLKKWVIVFAADICVHKEELKN